MKKYLMESKSNKLLYQGLGEWTNDILRPKYKIDTLSDLKNEDLIRFISIT